MGTNLKNALSFKLSKGYDIKIKGAPQRKIVDYKANTYAVNPKDIKGVSPIPKVEVVVGDEVKAGDVLFYDKKNPKIKYTAPVSGEVVEINRGEKRSIAKLVILGDKEITYKSFDVSNATANRESVIEHLLEGGMWAFIKQRPYNELAEIEETPRDIFVSCFDTNPMAPDFSFSLAGNEKYFQKGIEVLGKLTDGSVHLGFDGQGKDASAFDGTDAKCYKFSGKHPAGNVGIQIHHINPILKGDIIWTVGAEDVVTIGKYFTEGKYDPVRTVALGGPEVKDPQYYRTHLGANISGLLDGNLNNDHVRVISGNVLTGKLIDAANGHLGFYDNQISVIEEGDHYEMFGWLLPSYMRPSISRTFPAAFKPNYEHSVNTNTHGESRAFVVTGQYESVLPMNLYPQHLLKSIIANDLDKMEGLGIYEVVEEDLAICEFVCTSKQDVQKILRDGLEYLKEQG